MKFSTTPALSASPVEQMHSASATPAATQSGRKLIVIESSCAPFAEADDLIELQPGDFTSDGVYALEYVRPAGRTNWSGLRRVRAHGGHLEIHERVGGWVMVNEAVRFIGKVCGVHKPRSRHLFMPEIAA